MDGDRAAAERGSEGRSKAEGFKEDDAEEDTRKKSASLSRRTVAHGHARSYAGRLEVRRRGLAVNRRGRCGTQGRTAWARPLTSEAWRWR
eukprot:scaffold1607_cov71-Phaeocystis_antarctica.AAC.3